MTAFVLLAAALIEFSKGGVEFKAESETAAIDPARSVFLRLELKTPKGVEAAMPDLRERTVGFSLAEDFAEPVTTAPDGGTVQAVNWRLVPEPCAAVYKIKPFAVAGNVAGPVYFGNPAPREAVTGDMEVDPRKDLPPLNSEKEKHPFRGRKEVGRRLMQETVEVSNQELLQQRE